MKNKEDVQNTALNNTIGSKTKQITEAMLNTMKNQKSWKTSRLYRKF